ncbi:MAG: hypothetical protein U0798_16055 [Gemmataceae bacterium]
MLRGLTGMLEKHHRVRILDEAIGGAVRLSTRYMPDRQLPDKAISLLDTVCARVALSQSATPPALEDVTREIDYLGTEIQFLEREAQVNNGNPDRLSELKQHLKIAEEYRDILKGQLLKESELVTKISELRKSLESAKEPVATEKESLAKLTAELSTLQGETPLIYPVVDSNAVAEVLSGLTGILLGKMVRDEVQTVISLGDKLAERVVGQRHALEAIAQRIRTARADLSDPRRPQGVFLLVGPRVSEKPKQPWHLRIFSTAVIATW